MEAAGVINRLFASDPAARRRNLYLRCGTHPAAALLLVSHLGWRLAGCGPAAGCAHACACSPLTHARRPSCHLLLSYPRVSPRPTRASPSAAGLRCCPLERTMASWSGCSTPAACATAWCVWLCRQGRALWAQLHCAGAGWTSVLAGPAIIRPASCDPSINPCAALPASHSTRPSPCPPSRPAAARRIRGGGAVGRDQPSQQSDSEDLGVGAAGTAGPFRVLLGGAADQMLLCSVLCCLLLSRAGNKKTGWRPTWHRANPTRRPSGGRR